MELRVGILLDRNVLQKALSNKPVFERVDLYVEAAQELGIEIVLFDIPAINFTRRTVNGYVPDGRGGFLRQRVPLPKVVHNRAMLLKQVSGAQALRRLGRLGVHVFNPNINRDKYNMHRILFANPELRPHLPETIPLRRASFEWFRKRLIVHDEVFIKPRRGSLGQGIARVTHLGKKRYRYESSRSKITGSLKRVWRLTRRGRLKGFILQVGIPLAEVGGHRYDLRVPVQRNANGEWHVPGMAAKRTENHPFLTNIARGGTAIKALDAFRQSIDGVSAAEVARRVESLALGVAETLSRRYPTLADIGLDIGVDRDGEPFVIEVNRRDLRIILAKAGEQSVYASMYRNPLAYAAHLIHRHTSSTGVA